MSPIAERISPTGLGGAASNEEYVDLGYYLSLILRNYRLILAGTLLFAGAALAAVMLLPKKYTAEVSLLPPQDSQDMSPMLSQFQGLASSFGLGGKMGATDPMIFYETILRSRTFARMMSTVDLKSPRHATLYDGFEILPMDSLHRFEAFHARLLAAMEVVKADNGVMLIRLTTADPDFSARLLNRLVAEFEGFLRENQVSRARENLLFVEKRLGEVKVSLGEWEDRLREFKDRNQEITNSPTLQLRLRELMREVAISEEVFTLLKKEYEMAKIQDQREKPLIQVLDGAEAPLEHSFPQGRKTVLISVALGLMLFTALVVVFSALSKYSRFFGWFLAR